MEEWQVKYLLKYHAFAAGPIELVDGKKGKEWKVRYSNPAAADKTKQTLFIFFSHSGNFIAANFTGQ